MLIEVLKKMLDTLHTSLANLALEVELLRVLNLQGVITVLEEEKLELIKVSSPFNKLAHNVVVMER